MSETPAALLVATAAVSVLLLGFAAAVLALRARNVRKADLWAELEERWGLVLREVLAGTASRAALLDGVAPGERLYFVDFLLRQAAGAGGADRVVLHELASPFLPWVAERTEAPEPERRALAARTLGVLGLPAYGPRLVVLLADPAPLVAITAASALARGGHEEFIAPVLDSLERFGDWSTNFLAAVLQSAGLRAAPALREVLGNAGRPVWLRAAAADALAELGDAEAADLAAAIAHQERQSDLIAAALRLLGAVGRPEHRPVVRRLGSAADDVVRTHALAALGTVGGPEDIPRLRRALADTSPWAALQAAWALAGLGGQAALREVARSPDHPRALLARHVLAEALT